VRVSDSWQSFMREREKRAANEELRIAVDGAWEQLNDHIRRNPAPLYDGAAGRSMGIHHWSCGCNRCKR